jgi:hypothetical protein
MLHNSSDEREKAVLPIAQRRSADIRTEAARRIVQHSSGSRSNSAEGCYGATGMTSLSVERISGLDKAGTSLHSVGVVSRAVRGVPWNVRRVILSA